MTICDCNKNQEYYIKQLNIEDDKLKLRLYEIGFFVGSKIKILNKSFLNKTLLINVLDSCFAIKADVAKLIEVDYA